MVPTFTTESIDEGGARLDPDSIATPTPQFFDVASPPDRQTGFGVGPHRTSGTGHALHTGPYPSGLSRLWTYGASVSGSSRTPSHQCWPERAVEAVLLTPQASTNHPSPACPHDRATGDQQPRNCETRGFAQVPQLLLPGDLA